MLVLLFPTLGLTTCTKWAAKPCISPSYRSALPMVLLDFSTPILVAKIFFIGIGREQYGPARPASWHDCYFHDTLLSQLAHFRFGAKHFKIILPIQVPLTGVPPPPNLMSDQVLFYPVMNLTACAFVISSNARHVAFGTKLIHLHTQ